MKESNSFIYSNLVSNKVVACFELSKLLAFKKNKIRVGNSVLRFQVQVLATPKLILSTPIAVYGVV